MHRIPDLVDLTIAEPPRRSQLLEGLRVRLSDVIPALRLIAEGGAVIGRKLSVRANGNDIAPSLKAGTHGYFDLRLIAGS